MSSSTVRSTSGTAPITLSTGPSPEFVYIELPDGSSQVYSIANIARALVAIDPEEHT